MIKLIDLLENEESNKSTIQVNKDDQKGIMDVSIYDSEGDNIGKIELDSYDEGKTWTISNANIGKQYRGKGYYRQALINLVNKYPQIKVVSAFRSPEANRTWKSLISKAGNDYKITSKKVDGETEHYLSKN
jgi:hypothetical protein